MPGGARSGCVREAYPAQSSPDGRAAGSCDRVIRHRRDEPSYSRLVCRSWNSGSPFSLGERRLEIYPALDYPDQ